MPSYRPQFDDDEDEGLDDDVLLGRTQRRVPVNRPRTPSAPREATGIEVLVVQILGPQSVVEYGGKLVRCHMTKTLKDHLLPVVGDRVLIDPPSGDMSRIVAIQPRRTQLRRPDVHQLKADQIMVANLDKVLVVAAASSPPYNPGLIDRYLVAAWSEGLTPVVCVTKVDLGVSEEVEAALVELAAVGVKVLRTSIKTGEGLSDIEQEIAGQISVMVGLSGVGKTSLAQKLLGDHTLPVGEISDSTGRGKHTTTSARMFRLASTAGGYLVDCPGQRVFGLSDLTFDGLLRGFPELSGLEPCALPQCTHQTEEGCSLQEAVAQGRMTPRRYEALTRIWASTCADQST